MAEDVDIRPERATDIDPVACITEQAFRAHPHSQHTEQFIIAALRQSGALRLSLVAEVDGQAVGHIAFSPVQISDGSSGWYALGPVAVAPGFQNQGIGQALVNAGMEELHRLGARGCVVVGEPGFYERFGFRSNPCCTMEGVPQEYVLSLPLAGHPHAVGKIAHHEAFDARGPQTQDHRHRADPGSLFDDALRSEQRRRQSGPRGEPVPATPMFDPQFPEGPSHAHFP